MSFFIHETAANRYASSRPYFHPLVINKLKSFIGARRIPRALDVACGTGQSAMALKNITSYVVGTDVSEAMLSKAPQDTSISYVKAAAEELPFSDDSFDLITVSLAFHWFDRARFLNEAYRLLHTSGWLVIYNNWFTGEMKENAKYAEWNQNRYLMLYPSPARANQPFADSDAEKHKIRFVERESYTNDVMLSLEELTNYLTTQSNMIAIVEQGEQSLESARAWLTDSLKPLFIQPRCTFLFGGSIWYLQKNKHAND